MRPPRPARSHRRGGSNPGASGFDYWLSAPNFYDNDPILSRQGEAVQLQGERSMVAADAAIEFMRQQHEAGKPFLAVVWFGSPRSPHRAAEKDLAHYAGQKNARWLGEITGMDRAMGMRTGRMWQVPTMTPSRSWSSSITVQRASPPTSH